MKRKEKPIQSPAPSASAAPDKPKRPRILPVSCETCRAKKLRCDRAQPCSNCASRNVQCKYAAPLPGHRPGSVPNNIVGQQEKGVNFPKKTPAVVDDTVSAHAAQNDCQGNAENPDVENPGSNLRKEQLAMIDSLDEIPVNTTFPLLFRCAGGRRSDGDTDAAIPRLMSAWTVPLLDLLLPALPPEQEALDLYDTYLHWVSPLSHIIHGPTVEKQIRGIYESLRRRQSPNISHINLLFAILSCLAELTSTGPVSSNLLEKFSAKHEWVTLVGLALMRTDVQTSTTIESLQAMIIVLYALPHKTNIGLNRHIFLPSTIVTVARRLKLHLIDCPRVREERERAGYDKVAIEVQRRIWWHIVSIDWILGFVLTPQPGAYSIHPEHMNVNPVANIDDDELATKPAGFSHPIEVPTIMSFMILRLKIVAISREFVDVTMRDSLQGREVNYQTVLEADRKIRQLYDTMPRFFHLENRENPVYEELRKKFPCAYSMRIFVHQAFYMQTCKLHRAFFIRGATNPKYSYSHIVALNAARKLIAIHRHWEEQGDHLSHPGVSGFCFMAASVLLLDFCYNVSPDDILADRYREEILDACRIISKAQKGWPPTQEGMKALMALLNSKQPSSNKAAVAAGEAPQDIPQSGQPATAPASNDNINADATFSTSQSEPSNPVLSTSTMYSHTIPVTQTPQSQPNLSPFQNMPQATAQGMGGTNSSSYPSIQGHFPSETYANLANLHGGVEYDPNMNLEAIVSDLLDPTNPRFNTELQTSTADWMELMNNLSSAFTPDVI